MKSPEHDVPRTVRIDLTDSQRERVVEALGQGRVAGERLSLELSVDELEQRIAPRIMQN